MIAKVVWEACRLVGGSFAGRTAIQGVTKVFPVITRKTVVSYLQKQPQQAVLVIRQMARIFRNNASRSVESVAGEVVRSFKGITEAVGEGPATQFFTELWNVLSKDTKLLMDVLKG